MGYIKDTVGFTAFLNDPGNASKACNVYRYILKEVDNLPAAVDSLDDRGKALFKTLFSRDVLSVIAVTAQLNGVEFTGWESLLSLGESIQTNSVIEVEADGFLGVLFGANRLLTAAVEKLKAEGEQARLEEEKKKAEEEQARLEAERIRLEEEKKKAEEEQARLEAERKKAEEAKVDPEEEKAANSDKALIKKYREKYGSTVSMFVNNYMSTFTNLYSSCYDVSRHQGLLLSENIYKADSKGNTVPNGDKLVNMALFAAIQQALPNNGAGFGFNDWVTDADGNMAKEVEYSQLVKKGKPVVLYGLHLQFMYGYFRYCKGLQTYVKKKGGEGANTDKVLDWTTMQGWIREKLELTFYKAFEELGLPPEDVDSSTLNKVYGIKEVFDRSIKNAIVVYDYTKDMNTSLRICNGTKLQNPNEFVQKLQKALDPTKNSIEVRKVGDYDEEILDIQVIYSKKRFDSSVLYAHQVLDEIFDCGIKPAWDNVILGKDADTSKTLTYNFRNDKKPVMQLYAGSRSGKGVMTMNLLASALADGCKVMYIDGKPDSSVVLADIAWSAGKECCIFNGRDEDPALEKMPCCPEQRRREAFEFANGIPSIMFTGMSEVDISSKAEESADELRTSKGKGATVSGDGVKINRQILYRIMQYYRGLELFISMMADRSNSDIVNSGNNKDWVVAVFDEVQNMDNAENLIMTGVKANIAEFEKEVGKKDCEAKEEKLEAIKWYNGYTRWVDSIVNMWTTGKTITLGKAQCTAIFIWQTSDFPLKEHTSGFARILRAFQDASKIIGRGAMTMGGMTAFGNHTPIRRGEAEGWYDDRVRSIGGYFTICPNGLDGGEKRVFRPYNIYGNTNGKGRIIQAAKASGMEPEDLLGSSLQRSETSDDGFEVIPEVGFKGYAKKFLGHFGLDTATQLNIMYEYADAFVKRRSNGKLNLLDHMYSSNFGINSIGADSGDSDQPSSGSGQMPLDTPPIEEPDSSGMFDGEQGEPKSFESSFGFGGAEPKSESGSSSENRFGKSAGVFGGSGTAFGGKASLDDMVLKEKLAAEAEKRKQAEKVQEELNNLMASLDKIDVSDKDDPDLELFNKQRQEQLEIIKKASELIQVGLLENQAKADFTAKANGNIVYNVGKKDMQDAAPLTFKNSLKTTFSLGRSSFVQKVAGLRGIDSEAQEAFKELIMSLKESGFNVKMAGTMCVYESVFSINNREVPINNFIDVNNSMYRVVDIVDFNVIAKEFRGLQILMLDRAGFMKLYSQMNKRTKKSRNDYTAAIEMLFKKMPSLVEMRFKDYSNRDRVITRDSLNAETTQKALNNMQEEDIMSSRISMAGIARKGRLGLASKAAQAKTKVQADVLRLSGQAKAVAKPAWNVGKTSLVAYGLGAIAWPLGLGYAGFHLMKGVYALGKGAKA